MRFSMALAAAALILVFAAADVQADTITDGFTFAVASSSSDQSTGTHFHSSTGGQYGNPAGKAEVGRYSSEEVRGLSEYDLDGLSTAASAFVTFDVYDDAGLFTGNNDFPWTGTIVIEAYAGNNTENTADYHATTTATVGSFAVGSGLAVGDTLSFDITSIFNSALSNSWDALGIRLRADGLPTAGAWTFDTFRLTSTNESSAVPEPGTLALLGLGVLGLALGRRRKKALAS